MYKLKKLEKLRKKIYCYIIDVIETKGEVMDKDDFRNSVKL